MVGTAPTGAWAGHADALAGWTGGGWRFVPAREGMTVWTAGAGGFARYESGAWTTGALRGVTLSLAGAQVVGARQPAIADPASGTTIDIRGARGPECRAVGAAHARPDRRLKMTPAGLCCYCHSSDFWQLARKPTVL